MRIAHELGFDIDMEFNTENNTLLIVDKALNQSLMMMYNQYADQAVLSLRRLWYLLGERAGYAQLRDQLAQDMAKESKEETRLVDLNQLWL